MSSLIYYITVVCLFIPIYVYLGYPFLIWLLCKLIKTKKVNRADITPEVTLIVSCYNEANIIRTKIDNCLVLDYPKDKIEIIVISDGSDDGTDEIVKEFVDQGVRLIRQDGRLGKTSGLNLGVEASEAEIIVFSDANAIYDLSAIRMLVRNFNDFTVGYVVGAALYTDGGTNSASQSEDTYWKYEVFMKQLETQLHSVVGGDGAIYAIRRSLYEPLLAQDINDFVNPLQIIAKGYRGIFDVDAKCFEETAGSFDKEAKRKQRIVNRSFCGLMRVKETMNPFKCGFFSLEIISHKLLRWLIPFIIVEIVLGSIYLARNGLAEFQLLVILEVIFFWMAMVERTKANQIKSFPFFYYPYYFLVVNYNSMIGVMQAIKGDIQVTWSSSRDNNRRVDKSQTKNFFRNALLILISIYLFVDSALRLLS